MIIQKNLAKKFEDFYMEKFPNNQIAHAFIPKKSIYTNVKKHVRKKYIIHLDLKDFFPSFHFGRIKGFFEKNNFFLFNEKLSIQMANLLCYKGKLPQGAPTSPIITNFICQSMDYYISKLCSEYHLLYTRYADDLIFSTNDKKIVVMYDDFNTKVNKIVKKCGFIINEDKTKFVGFNERHLVTGLVINQKINYSLDFYKKTRAMAYYFYKNKLVFIDEKNISKYAIEGRFSFICQTMKINRTEERAEKGNLNSRLNEYRKFIFFTRFYSMDKPLVITEGKTDPKYIKAALIHFKNDYPSLIKEVDGKYIYSFSFFNRTDNILRFFKCQRDGADAITTLTKFFYDAKSKDTYMINLYSYFYKICGYKPNFPIICIYDNETRCKDKPLAKLIKNTGLYLNSDGYTQLYDSNMFILPIPNNGVDKDIEIEDLFLSEVLDIEIGGRKFDRKTEKGSDTTFGKKVFANYVYDNLQTINFDKFKPLLDKIVSIIKKYN